MLTALTPNTELHAMGDPIPTKEFQADVEQKHLNENWGFHEEYSVKDVILQWH